MENPNEQNSKLKYIAVELVHHLPYSIYGVTTAIVFLGIVTFFAALFNVEGNLPSASVELFHVMHAAHVLLSAVTTTALFWKYEKKFIKALFVGFVGSIVICTISDICFPFIGGKFLTPMDIHICVLEEPQLVIPFAVVGILSGFSIANVIENSTQYSHSAHVFVSSVSSILYLIAFGLTDWIHALGAVLLITIVAVMIPCCLSDIVYPLSCLGKRDCNHF